MSQAQRGDETSGLRSVLAGWRGLRALVIGDVMLDEARRGDVERVSPEAPVPIVSVEEARRAPGGAANVARNLVALGAQCTLVGVVGEDEEADALREELATSGLEAEGLVVDPSRPTTHKLRVVADGRQLVRLDREATRAVSPDVREALRSRIAAALASADFVVLEDYDKGLFADGLGAWTIARARAAGRRVMVDPKTDLARFRGADLVKPNQAEAIALLGGEGEALAIAEDPGARRALLEKLCAELGGGEVVVTRGRDGMTALDRDGTFVDVPTRPRAVYDVQGAGDTAIAALALARAAGLALADACRVANAAASVAVGKVGTAAVSAAELEHALAGVSAVEREHARAATIDRVHETEGNT